MKYLALLLIVFVTGCKALNEEAQLTVLGNLTDAQASTPFSYGELCIDFNIEVTFIEDSSSSDDEEDVEKSKKNISTCERNVQLDSSRNFSHTFKVEEIKQGLINTDDKDLEIEFVGIESIRFRTNSVSSEDFNKLKLTHIFSSTGKFEITKDPISVDPVYQVIAPLTFEKEVLSLRSDEDYAAAAEACQGFASYNQGQCMSFGAPAIVIKACALLNNEEEIQCLSEYARAN